MKWINRIVEYHKDKILAEKCGLEVKDICIHEKDKHSHCIYKGKIWGALGSGCLPKKGEELFHCKKCGGFYR